MPRACSTHQKVIEHVGGFRDHAALVLANRGKRGLDRLLAELFGALGHAAVEQLSRIGHVRALLGAALHALFQVMEGERCHVRFLSISLIRRDRARTDGRSRIEPHRQTGGAMYSLASRTEYSPK